MYVDNELTEAQRTEVEAFVQHNPDLTEELAMLQESVLLPDDLTFSGKESLYKIEDSININNYEEYFLLDVDNELSTTEKADVEKFVLQHPKLQNEYTLLHQTKLEAEVIEFKDKSSLYRTEEKERRVIPMRFMKFAIAASVIGLIATLWMVYPDKPGNTPTLASNEKNVPSKADKKDPKQTVLTSENDEKVAGERISNEPLVGTEKIARDFRKVATKDLNDKLPVSKFPANQPEREDEMLAHTNPKQQIETGEVDRVSEVTNTEPEFATNSNKNIIKSDASFARPAVYKEVDDEEDDRSFLIGSVEINKNKLRGLIKKASTLFDKKSKPNDSERTIQIASFEIKTK